MTAFAETLLDIYRTNEKNDRQVIYVVFFSFNLNLVVFIFDVVTLASLVPVRKCSRSLRQLNVYPRLAHFTQSFWHLVHGRPPT